MGWKYSKENKDDGSFFHHFINENQNAGHIQEIDIPTQGHLSQLIFVKIADLATIKDVVNAGKLFNQQKNVLHEYTKKTLYYFDTWAPFELEAFDNDSMYAEYADDLLKHPLYCSSLYQNRTDSKNFIFEALAILSTVDKDVEKIMDMLTPPSLVSQCVNKITLFNKSTTKPINIDHLPKELKERFIPKPTA